MSKTEVDFYEDWVQIGATPDVALAWDMDIVFAELWMDAGFERSEANDFLELGFEVDDAEWWHQHGVCGRELLDAVPALNRCDVSVHAAVALLEMWAEAGQSIDSWTLACVEASVGFDGLHL